MRLIFGMIIGVSLTVGAAYIADVVGGPDAKPLVNWEVADSSGFVHQTSILPR
jgi:hypothetical protein